MLSAVESKREIQRAIVRLVLKRGRTLACLERLLVGPRAVDAAKQLAADGVVIRHGELLWAPHA